MQVTIHLTVQFDGAFNIGAGSMGGSFARRPLLLNWRGLPYLPGSSFKGRLRHTCKQLAAGLKHNTCDEPRAETMCPNGPEANGYCPVCQLFGAPGRPSPLIFSDFQLSAPEFLASGAEPVPTSLRYGVGISRRRRVAEDRLLFDTEVFTPGGPVAFSGTISGRLQPPKLLGLLLIGLEQLTTLGSGKTAGLGWCGLEITQFEAGLSQAEARQRWLTP